MSFFSSVPPPPPPPEPLRQPRPAWMQPDEVIPGSVPGELLLIRTQDVAVAIGGICAYPNGFEFTVHVRVRSSGDLTGQGLMEPFNLFGRRGAQSSDVLQLGLQYADGRCVATTGGWMPDDPGQERVLLQPSGASGGSRRWDSKFWVHPLPPDGPVIFVAAWAEYGAAEIRAELDGTAIRAASARAVTLWPDDPDIEPGPRWNSATMSAYTPDEPDRSQH
jgi:hypothetical protein